MAQVYSFGHYPAFPSGPNQLPRHLWLRDSEVDKAEGTRGCGKAAPGALTCNITRRERQESNQKISKLFSKPSKIPSFQWLGRRRSGSLLLEGSGGRTSIYCLALSSPCFRNGERTIH
jgi:hypothetical protein